MPDNLFTIASKSKVGNFIKESCLPKCPRVIVHGESMAAHFFRDLLDPPSAVPAAFVSVVGVREASDSKLGGVETCVATLVALRRPRSDTDSTTDTEPEVASVVQNAPLIRTLDNGDVRVIQSAATDVMLRQTTPLQDQQVTDIEAGVPEVKTCEMPASIVTKNEDVSSSDLLALQALKYQCPAAKLEEFVGTHFHIGELTIDADAASSILHPPRKPSRAQKSKSAQKDELQSEKFAAGMWTVCMAGIAKICDGDC
jgi:hypothetical protein